MPETSFDYDLVIIGGGVNGAGIARDAAGRGYKTLLVEQDDLASHTSSGSSKLIHGGLRYLEYYEFKLVREALNEREVLLDIAPHIIWPLRFVLPHNKSMRPAWMVRAGLWLYDHLGKRERLEGSKAIKLNQHQAGQAMKPEYQKAFTYADCWVQDARLVALNAMAAREEGAQVMIRTRCESAKAFGGGWQLQLIDQRNQTQQLSATFLVNATGPWVDDFAKNTLGLKTDHAIRLVSGGHIIVPKLFAHDMAYIFQNPDNRIIFAIPYEQDYTLIGTTELEVDEFQKSAITDNEITYLCDSANRYFEQQIKPEDVVWDYTGIRPLLFDGCDDATAATREYQLDLLEHPAPSLSVYGGKITTFRSLAENALNKIDQFYGKTPKPWTHSKALPGGDFKDKDFTQYLELFKSKHPWLAEELAHHYVRNYGSRAEVICRQSAEQQDLGQDFGAGLLQAEIDYLIEHEWVMTAEDLLWRRSKWGLRLNQSQQQNVADYIAGKVKL